MNKRSVALSGLIGVVVASCGTGAYPGAHAIVAAASCRATPVHTTPFPRPDLRGIPWLMATPATAGITGILFFRHPGARGAMLDLHTHGRMPDGSVTKILWLIDNPKAGRRLQISGRNLTGAGRMQQSFPFSGSRQVPSIVIIPTPGCWELQLRSGSAQGTVTMPVLP